MSAIAASQALPPVEQPQRLPGKRFEGLNDAWTPCRDTLESGQQASLARADHAVNAERTGAAVKVQEEQVRIGKLGLPGSLLVPKQAKGLVVFAHCGDCNCQRAQSTYRVAVMERLSIATLLLDLLTDSELDQSSNVELLGRRLEQVLDWLAGRRDLVGMRVGLFGSFDGAAAALWTAAMNPNRIGAVVSRAGRLGAAFPYLPRVQAPTLLIAGGGNAESGQTSRSALGLLHCNKRLEIVPTATFEQDEPAVVETVAHLAGTWFQRHLPHRYAA